MTTPRPLDRVAGAHDAAVLALARRGDPVSRAELAAALQVTPQAISKILARLQQRGLVAEAGTVSAGPGKPTTLYRIEPTSRRAVGVHLTRSRLHGVVVDLTGEIIERREIEVGAPPPVPDLVAALAGMIRELSGIGPGELVGAGVGMPGPVDGELGIYRGTADPDPWRGAPIRSLLLERVDLPVLVDHDSRAALVGEAWSEPGLLRDAALLLVEDGIGAAFSVDGSIVRGAHAQAGEAGHTVVRIGGEACSCGRRGCAQAEYLAALGRDDHEDAARILATVVLNLVRTVDVDRVVLGGRTVYADHAVTMDAIRRALVEGLGPDGAGDDTWLHVEVLLSTRGTDLISVGAACEVLEHEFGIPRALVGPA